MSDNRAKVAPTCLVLSDIIFHLKIFTLQQHKETKQKEKQIILTLEKLQQKVCLLFLLIHYQNSGFDY